jgi:hypothetical protein
MPFKSEKQRRYLFANEPEIARDWTETYGSKIQKADGGIMRIPFQGGGADMGAPDRAQERADRGYGDTGGVQRSGDGNNNQFTSFTKENLNPQKDYMGPTRFGPARKYTGSFLDNVFSRGYRPVTPTGQFQSRLSQYGGNILSGIMGAINPFLGILSRGFQNFRDTPYLQDYISNLRPRQMSDVFVDQGRGGGIRTIPNAYMKLPGSTSTDFDYNFDLAKLAEMIEKARTDDYYTGNISFEEQIARNKQKLEDL